MNIFKKIILSFFLFIFIFSIGFSIHLYKYYTISKINEDIYFIINKGDNFKKVIINLNNQKILDKKYNLMYFYIAKIFYKNEFNLKIGEYIFPKNSNLIDILKIIQNKKVFYRKITFAEGLTVDTILKIIDKTYGLMGDLPNYEIKEGSLLPETYLYTYGETKESLIKRMQKDMNNFINKEWEKRQKDLPFSTIEEAISLSSIVEKETGIKTERGKVASVFVNRLKKKMKLQSDPTVIYAFTKGNKDLEREIRRSDLKAENEYNTYYIYGIPKSPICNPGKDAIIATLNPENTDYLYFVATGNGGHNFSSTLKEHNNYVKTYRETIKNNKINNDN